GGGGGGVVRAGEKNSGGEMRRPPRRDCSTTVPPHATRANGISALGSAWATDPPSVPRLRVWKWPTHGSAIESSGTSRAMTSERSASLCVSPAPAITTLLATEI